MQKSGDDIDELLKEFENLPKTSEGRIDYHQSNRALVMNCFVKYKDKILILKRSNQVLNYKRQWNAIGGFIDEDKSIEEKVLEELKEEVCINKDNISEIKVKDSWELHDPEVNKTWIIFPVLVELKEKPEIKLDWEHTEYKWIKPEEISSYDIIYKLEENLKRVLG